jgi:hypothetical protein
MQASFVLRAGRFAGIAHCISLRRSIAMDQDKGWDLPTASLIDWDFEIFDDREALFGWV